MFSYNDYLSIADVHGTSYHVSKPAQSELSTWESYSVAQEKRGAFLQNIFLVNVF